MQAREYRETMEASVDSIFDSTKMLLKNNKILSKKIEENLIKVREIEQHLEAINQNCDTEQQSDENQGVVAMKNACTAVVYGSYIKEKTDAAGLALAVKKMEIDKFPESIQPKGYEIKGYVEEIAAQLEEIDNLIKDVEKMVSSHTRNEAA